MSPASFQILPYGPAYEQPVNELAHTIHEEFKSPVSTQSIQELSLNKNEWYWVAVSDGKVVGTAGLMDLSNDRVILKRMMLAKERRGKEHGIAVALLNTVIRAARQQNNSEIYLGITEPFKGARKFYSQNGFKEISKEDLPPDFIVSPADSLFFKRNL